MTGAIKEYKPFRVITMKDGNTIEVDQALRDALKKQLREGYEFIDIGEDTYNKFQIKHMLKRKIVTDIDQFILSQPKSIRDRVNTHATENNIIWNSIEHVTNFITNNKD